MKARALNKEKRMKLQTSVFSVGPVLVGLAVFLMTVGQARATLLAEETFNYPAGSNLVGLSGGIGWGTNLWFVSDGAWTNWNPGLTVSGIATSANNCAKTATTSAQRTAGRSFSMTYSNGIVYLGAMLRPDSGSVEYGFMQVVEGTHYLFKATWTTVGSPTSNYWTLQGGTGNNTWNPNLIVTTAVKSVQGQAQMAVIKMNLDTKTGYLYLNQATEGTPDATTTSVYSKAYTITVRTANGGASMDEIRLATNYVEAVYGIPPTPPSKATVIQFR